MMQGVRRQPAMSYSRLGMKRVFVASNPIEAKFVKDFLESAGLPVKIRGEYLYGILGSLPVSEDTLPSVWVLYEEDYEQARALLAKVEARARFRMLPAL
jgi:hypothetical protein